MEAGSTQNLPLAAALALTSRPARDVELCRWDIRVRYEGGARQSWPAVNLCDTVRVELR